MEASRGYWELEGSKCEFIDDVKPGMRRLIEAVWWLVAAVCGLMEARWGYWMVDEG